MFSYCLSLVCPQISWFLSFSLFTWLGWALKLYGIYRVFIAGGSAIFVVCFALLLFASGVVLGFLSASTDRISTAFAIHISTQWYNAVATSKFLDLSIIKFVHAFCHLLTATLINFCQNNFSSAEFCLKTPFWEFHGLTHFAVCNVDGGFEIESLDLLFRSTKCCLQTQFSRTSHSNAIPSPWHRSCF